MEKPTFPAAGVRHVLLNDELRAMLDYSEYVAGAGMLFIATDTQPAGLLWAYGAGRVRNASGAIVEVATGQIALTGSATNYIEIDNAGAVSKSTVGFTLSKKPLRLVTTDSGSVLTSVDKRIDFDFTGGGSGGGTTWRVDEGVPSDALGLDGDFYIDSETSEFYEKVAGTYELRGNLQGENGASILSGSGAPDDADGADGDYYIDTDNGGLYLKLAGAWAFQANLTGPAGIPGGSLNYLGDWVTSTDYEVDDAVQNGTPKSSYRCHTAHTSGSTTEPGIGAGWEDYWFLYAQAGGTGATGTTGTPGSQILNGTTTPNDADGVNGDWYLRTSTSDLYKKAAGAWALQVNLKGIQGIQGNTGPGYTATSTTSLAIATGSKAFTTQAGLAYSAGARVRATSAGDLTKWMEGIVASYSGTTLTVTVDLIHGTGTLTDWNLSLAAPAPAPTLITLTDASTIAVNAALGNSFANRFEVSSAVDRTLGIPSNAAEGMGFILRWRNTHATLAKTLTLTTTGAGCYRFTQDVPSIPATAAGKWMAAGFMYDAVDQKWDVVSFVRGA